MGDLAISEIAGAVMVAEWHTHPYKVGEKVPQCGTAKFSKPKEVAGVDPKDYKALDDLNAARQGLNYPPVIAFVWDRTHVYRYDSTMPKNKRPYRPNPVHHTRTDCTWNP